jgi:5-methylcytosine-specific restriction protein B
MYRKEDQTLYALISKFIDKCLINNDSLLTTHKNCFSEANINDCISRFVDNSKDDKRNFENKIKEQFDNSSDEVKIVFAHANWIWAFSVNDMNAAGKRKAVQMCMPDGIEPSEKTDDGFSLFPMQGFGSSGTYHKQNKYLEMVSILKILKWMKVKIINNSQITEDEVKDNIENACLFAKYDETENPQEEWQKDLRKIDNSCAMYNILLYLCKSKNYERIASDNHKNRIVDSFSSLLDDDKISLNIDEKILSIRSKIKESIKKDFDFYDEDIIVLWNPGISDSKYNEIQGLSFKKNIILYGPPGTGKTHDAKLWAKSFIIQKMIRTDKSKVKDYFDKKIKIDNRIMKLQLHSNYSYEDFIAGITLKNGNTEAVKGYFYQLCEDIENDLDKSPYILILDEINRIDLSRLFGEVFSAIENRNEEIDLSVGGFKLKIPENLYIIGTMNEIDFSLERLDFALRRRFVWFRYGYEKQILKEIINIKKKNINIDEDEINIFIDRCSKINNKIDELNDLGKQYEIGHTFFSEIIDISSQFVGRPGYMGKIKLFKTDGPANVLWNISIEPIITAFLGNLDETQKDERIKELKEIFINGK